MAALLVFWALGAGFFAFVIPVYGWAYLRAIVHNQDLAASVAGSILLIALISGFGTYFSQRKRQDTQLKELSSLVSEMKKIEAEGQKASGDASEGITKHALSLADKVTALLPEMARKRDPDALLFGLVSFVVASVGLQNLIWAIPIAAVVWLFVGYETRKRYRDEISKFEEKRRAFEQRKKDFLETL